MTLITKRNGSDHWNSKLTDDDISTIFEVHKEYLKAKRGLQLHSPEAIAESFGRKSCDFYYDVINNKQRRTITAKTRAFILRNEAKRIELREDYLALSPEAMAPKFDISVQHYRDIVNGKYWKLVGEDDA